MNPFFHKIYQLFVKMLQRLPFLLFLSLFSYHSASLTDTITPTRPLKDGQVLTSGQGSNFALGFFSPRNSTHHRYVGIWYNKVSVQTVVWVANRDRPFNGSVGILSIGSDGNLVLSSHNSTVWSTNFTYKRNHTDKDVPKAQLLDSGNLILLIGGRSQVVAWQSFDHPDRVFLPGMKIRYDRRTGLSSFLNSWRSKDDPSPGDYSYKLDPDGGSPEIFLYKNGSVPAWRTGPWVGHRFSGIPDMAQDVLDDFSFVDSPDEVYHTYKMRSSSYLVMFQLDGDSGKLQHHIWDENGQQWIMHWAAPQDDCDNYAKCGAFSLCKTKTLGLFDCSCLPGYQPKSQRKWNLRNASEGCERARNVSMCNNGEGFLKMGSVKLPDTSTAKTIKSKSLEECREECLNNCSCLAYTSATDNGGGAADGDSGGPSGCLLFHGDLTDVRVYPAAEGQDLYIRVDAVDLAKNVDKSKGHHKKIHLVIILPSIITIFMIVASFACWFCRKKRTEWREQEENSLWLREAEENDSISDVSGVFPLRTIAIATENFNPINKLGEGGFGPVYKGKLPDGREIAVKRLSKNSRQGINEFKNEVRLIAKLQHKNLVKMLGCCVGGEEKMLIYEFLPNKSLDKYIFDEKKRTLLDWSMRHNIIIGIARGVLYLHQDSRLKIIHRDLKAGNILLDATMTPKISDFGIARIFGNDQIEENTNRVVGTYGYMSPEYAMEGLFSIKSDVFSFGVILLEIISGKKSSRYYNEQPSTNLIGCVWKLWQDGNAMRIVDKSILSTSSHLEDEILRCIQIGLLCVQENPNERPTMSEVIFMLSNKFELPTPNHAFVILGRPHNNGDPSSTSTGALSVNEFTTTEVEAR